ncbi:hypothetical protein Tco_1328525 [Tanacetum coccineum]
MDLTGYEVPRVLVTCRSQQLEVEGEGDENVPLFGVENLADYEDVESRIPFRRCVFPSNLDGEPITGNMLVLLGVEGKRMIPDWLLRLANDRVGWDNYPWGSYVWPTLYSQLKNANVRRWPKLYATQPTSEIDTKSYSIFGYTWAFKGNLPSKRLTPDETEARSDWWISSRAYFDGRIGQAERVRPTNKEPIIVSQRYGISDLREFPSMQGGPSSFQTHPNSSSFFNIGTSTHWQTPPPSQPGSSNWQAHMPAQHGPSNWQSHMPAQSATPYWQPAFPSHPGTYNPNLQPSIKRHHDVAGLFNQNILNRGKREQRPSFYKRTPYMEQPPTTVLPKQRGNKNKKNVKKANLSPLNLRSAFDDENERGDDVIYLGGQFTGNYLVYENVDPEKVKRENYVNYTDFLNNPEQIYLDCYMKGYSVPVTFWQQLVPHLCRPAIDSRTPMGWLSTELLIRLRRSDDPWTVAYTNTISVHPENQRFMLEMDQHTIETLDGSTRPCFCPYMLEEIIGLRV